MDSSDCIAERLAVLQARFRARCVDRSASLSAACKAGDLTAISSLAHDITGSAGLFGYPTLSEEASNISELCRGGVADEPTIAAARALSASLLRVAGERA
jgi:HPt (histidine-containing phosphotransfer) domain-containing protein